MVLTEIMLCPHHAKQSAVGHAQVSMLQELYTMVRGKDLSSGLQDPYYLQTPLYHS